ncbi:MAG: N-acetyl-gamma-glutamyl-phosphate reductase [Nitrososphaerota archaeon]|nr:N-acetyl-gamma-glutamyl-phosphate reductase [Candidatus Calditenuaceae archaeon]MDW8073563.1 N-acetyl-gamma-glutamyl-phosphate reductase [Nitrososphaerota archaeon]
MSHRVAIVGASGYTGGEALRLLANHPSVEVVAATSREYAGKPVSAVHLHLRSVLGSMKFSELNLEKIVSEAELVYLSVPSGVSQGMVRRILEAGLRVLDLSPDFRLKEPRLYEEWYGFTHRDPELLAESIYGLPEIHREEIRRARLVACPGCNATAAILALAPVAREGLIDLDHVAVDVKVGSSEAGRQPDQGTHHPERANVIRPYEAAGHRHVAEVEQELSLLCGRRVRVAMVPHAVGNVRGALATAHVWLTDTLDETTVWRAYAKHYGREPFIRIVRAGPVKYPDPKYIIGSNFCDVGFAVEPSRGRAALFAAIDNLMKGAAGQAVQCMNIMLGLDEREGLNYFPVSPV